MKLECVLLGVDFQLSLVLVDGELQGLLVAHAEVHFHQFADAGLRAVVLHL